jgi:hypothetical protein
VCSTAYLFPPDVHTSSTACSSLRTTSSCGAGAHTNASARQFLQRTPPGPPRPRQTSRALSRVSNYPRWRAASLDLRVGHAEWLPVSLWVKNRARGRGGLTRQRSVVPARLGRETPCVHSSARISLRSRSSWSWTDHGVPGRRLRAEDVRRSARSVSAVSGPSRGRGGPVVLLEF